MILPDINLLLYATDQHSLFHHAARDWWCHCINGAEPIGLAAPVALGFVRLSTRPAFARPLPVAVSTAIVREWLTRSNVSWLTVSASDLECALTLLDRCGTAGNLVGDAVLAALAIAHNAVIYSADADFSRLKPARWHNPLTG